MEASDTSSDENEWEALKKCLGDKYTKDFALIGSVVFEGKTIFEYKHIKTRETIHIDQEGKTYRPVTRPESPESDFFERITKAEAKEHVFGQTPRLRE